MSERKYVIVLDVGTSGAKGFIFDDQYNLKSKKYFPIKIISLHKGKGHVEQDPREIIKAAKQVLREVFAESQLSPKDITGMGITNQRETTVLWDKKTTWPLYPAIVWNDKRTEKYCLELKDKEKTVREKTGLKIEPYFSASKIHWLLENVPAARPALENNYLACGTVDSWLLWNLAEGSPFLTDQTNAARTLLFNAQTRKWDKELLDLFEIPEKIIPEVKSIRDDFGFLREDILGFKIPIQAICGDQQAGLYAAGHEVGTTKVTYGTGTFVMQIIPEFKIYEDFFTTISGANGSFAVEGKIEKGGKQVEPLLNNPTELRKFLEELAGEVDVLIKNLPIKPKELILDGGVMRDGIIAEMQEKISGIPVKNQLFFDGTALGVAKMIFGE